MMSSCTSAAAWNSSSPAAELDEQVVRPHGARDGVPAPVAEQRSEAFASAQQISTRVGEALEVLRDGAEVRRALVEELLEPVADDVD